jgi:hypothetical protein
MSGLRSRHAMKCTAKFSDDSAMNSMTNHSSVGLLKKPMLASCVEKPPVAVVENAWQMASNGDMPRSQ